MKRVPSPTGGAEPRVSPADDEVISRILAGEREMYAVLVRRYQESLFRFALGMVGSSDVAADIVQDTMVKAFTSLSRCREPVRFRAWVQQILRNRCLDHLKRHRRQISINDIRSAAVEDAGVERRIHDDEIRQALLAALATLPDSQREAFLLKHLDECTYEEMSVLLGASVSALKMRVKRAREALQSVLVGPLSA